jgi:SEC-C motif-containing protein
MRSRYAAFALGLGDYLVRTLASSHADRQRPLHELARDLSRVRERQRFTGLRIVRVACSGDSGEVLFLARIFEGGVDRSFGELSTFVREAGAWRYASGELVAVEQLSRSV